MLCPGHKLCNVHRNQAAGQGVVTNQCTEATYMETPFLAQVEDRWTAMRRMPSCCLARSAASRPGSGRLVIRVETGEAKATISAAEAQRTLDITVQRFKEERVLSEGPCHSDHEVDQRLRSLCTELSASPFA